MLKIPILLYHDLESSEFPSEKSNLASQGIVVDVKKFEEQLRYFADNGYKTISINDFLNSKKAGKALPAKSLILTFDDGHCSNYNLAFPSLLKFGFSATFFIVADWIGKEHYMTTIQIREMIEKGMEFGSHGLTHKYLPDLCEKEISKEVTVSKQKLNDCFGEETKFFAFPGGHHNDIVLKEIKKAGYLGACSCIQGFNSKKTNIYLLRRVEIRKNHNIDDMQNIFKPLNMIFYQSVDLVKGILKKTVGLKNYSEIRKKMYKYYWFKR